MKTNPKTTGCNQWTTITGESYLHMLCERKLVPKLKVENVDVNIPNGNAPIPSDIWKPPSPNPNPWNVAFGSGSVRWPAGRGGTFELGFEVYVFECDWKWNVVNYFMLPESSSFVIMQSICYCALTVGPPLWCCHGHTVEQPFLC